MGSIKKQNSDRIDYPEGASLWVLKAIRCCWDYNVNMWVGCNKQLHHTDRIKDMKGRKELITAIKEEFKVGPSRGRLLSIRYGFSFMFRKK